MVQRGEMRVNWTDLLARYLPPRLVQAALMLALLVALFGSGTVRRWIEAMGAAAALCLLSLEGGG